MLESPQHTNLEPQIHINRLCCIKLNAKYTFNLVPDKGFFNELAIAQLDRIGLDRREEKGRTLRLKDEFKPGK